MTKPIVRSTPLTVSDLATIYGCCGLFDLCTDRDLMSLSFEGASPFLDWLGWQITDVCIVRKSFITFVRPEYSGGRATSGYLSDPCGDSSGVEWGKCDFLLEDFSRLRRHGPVRDITMNDVRYCEAQPRYRLDGTQINSDTEYDVRLALEVIMQDLKRMVVDGNATTAGQFDGLERLVKTGYTDPSGRRCASMDSIVIDWNGNGMDGGAGITWNGAAIAATYGVIDVLLAAFRRILQRIQWSPALAAQALRVGDMALVLPTQLARCILDSFTCWSVCPGAQFAEANLNTFEARNFRNQLNGGMFNAGRIFLDGIEIPLITYDWGLQKSPTLADMYLLTGSIGSIKTLQGQLLDMRGAVAGAGDLGYSYTDGGRLLTWGENDGTCIRRQVEMRPRMLAWAPWAQVRFQDVRCAQPGGALSPDPLETSFFPETSFSVAACP